MTITNPKDRRELEVEYLSVQDWAYRVFHSCRSAEQRKVATRYYHLAQRRAGRFTLVGQFSTRGIHLSRHQPYRRWLYRVARIRPDLNLRRPKRDRQPGDCE